MPAEAHRKLAAILSADAVGLSRLMQGDEPATVETLNASRGDAPRQPIFLSSNPLTLN